MGWGIRTDAEAKAALDKSNEEREQRFLDSMKPADRQKAIEERASKARAQQYVTGPQARLEDRIDFRNFKNKLNAGDPNAITEKEMDVNDKAYRQAENEMKREAGRMHPPMEGMKKGGKITAKKKGGMIKASASKRADGCAQRGKTRGKMI